MIGYKGFDKDFKCRGYQYEVGKIYEHDGEIGLCRSGFHFCKTMTDVFNHYSAYDCRYAEVEAIGEIKEGEYKCVTSKIRIVREIPRDEAVAMSNTGDWNTGNWNTGNWNTGNCNTGNRNTGNCNTGDWNKSNYNSGCFMTIMEYIDEVPSAQPEPSTEIQEILNYLDTTLHPIVSPDNWNVYAELHDMVSKLPSAQPERKNGRWEMKPDPFGFFEEIPVCSECGCTTKMRDKTKFCPYCGAKMDGERKE